MGQYNSYKNLILDLKKSKVNLNKINYLLIALKREYSFKKINTPKGIMETSREYIEKTKQLPKSKNYKIIKKHINRLEESYKEFYKYYRSTWFGLGIGKFI